MAWTPIISGTDMQGVSLQEIWKGYRERFQINAYGDPTSDPIVPLPAGTNIQEASFWKTIQLFVDETAIEFSGQWVDWTQPVGGGIGSYCTMFDLDTFRVAADLNGCGAGQPAGKSFRRKQNMADAFSYGYCTRGDIFGPWLYEDIQKTQTAMKWTTRNRNSLTPATEYTRTGNSDPYQDDCNLARSTSQTNWNAATYGANTIGLIYYIQRSFSWNGYYYKFDNSRHYGRARPTSYANKLTTVDCDWECYAFLEKGEWYRDFRDLDGLGMVEDVYTLIDSGTRSDYLFETKDIRNDANYNDWPTGMVPNFNCSLTPSIYDGCLMDADNDGWVFKWQFTNA